MTALTLPAIIALARAGALDRAWAEFGAAGFDRLDQPAALTVKGRLLKDRALRASGEARRAHYLQSAEAYRRAAELAPATYPLINAATLSLLSGDRDAALALARDVLARIERAPDEPETPYWLAATEAEALVLLGRMQDAAAALDRAVAAAPRAWEDHASTLRQLLVVHDALGVDAAWLERLRPPPVLHYTGRLAPASADAEAVLAAAIAAALERVQPEFGFGALAAGSDILFAEALIARGGALIVVLPSDPEHFARDLVDPHGVGWRARFDSVLTAAEEVRLVRPLQASPDHVALADEIARGAALLHAAPLMAECVDIAAGTLVEGRSSAVAGAATGVPLALLAIGAGAPSDPDYERRLAALGEALARGPAAAIDPYLERDTVLVGYGSARAAADVARTLLLGGDARLRVAAHFGLVPCVREPFRQALRPAAAGTELVSAILHGTPAETICASHDFAAILAAGGGAGEASLMGELDALDGGAPIGLYALSP